MEHAIYEQRKFAVLATYSDGTSSDWQVWALSSGKAINQMLQQIREWQGHIDNVAAILATPIK